MRSAWFVPVVALGMWMPAPSRLRAEAVTDEFEGDSISPAWSIECVYAGLHEIGIAECRHALEGGYLVAEEILPDRFVTHQQPGSCEYRFSRPFAAPGQLSAEIRIAWDSRGADSAMQGVGAHLLAGGESIAWCGYYDPWFLGEGASAWFIGAAGQVSPQGSMPAAGEAEIRIERDAAGSIEIFWDDAVIGTGSSAAAVDEISIRFRRSPYEGSTLGYIAVDRISAVGADEPPPAAIAGFVFDDRNSSGELDEGEGMAGAVVFTRDGASAVSEPDGSFFLGDLASGALSIGVEWEGQVLALRYADAPPGESRLDLLVNADRIRQALACAEASPCAGAFAELLPSIDGVEGFSSLADALCADGEADGDAPPLAGPLLHLRTAYHAAVLARVLVSEEGFPASLAAEPGAAATAVTGCAESALWSAVAAEGGSSAAIFEGLLALRPEASAVLARGPADIRIRDSAGRILERGPEGSVRCELALPAGLSRGPGGQELALAFDAASGLALELAQNAAVPGVVPIDLQVYAQAAGGPFALAAFLDLRLEGMARATVALAVDPAATLSIDRDGDGEPDEDLSGAVVLSRMQRGDVNADGKINITDPVAILLHLFSGVIPELDCEKAADCDDSGGLSITDAIALLGFLFLGSAPPPPPLHECRLDSTLDALSCLRFPPCAVPPE